MNKREILYHQFLCVLPICCLYFMIGAGRTWVAPIVNEATDPHSELPMTTEQCSWLASLGYATRGISPFVLTFTVDRVGRIPIMVFNAIIFFGMWIAVYWSRDIAVHYIVRLAYGLCDGLQDTVSSIYVCENCSPQYRGIFFTVVIVFLFVGQFIEFVLANYYSYNTIGIVYAVLGFITLLSTLLLVEPAQFSLMKGNENKAKKNFSRLRNMEDPDSVKEFEAMKKNMEDEKKKKVNLDLYKSKEVLRSLRITLIVMPLCSGCGWGPIMSFATKLFSNSNGISANQLSIFYGLLQLISVVFSSVIMEQFNRRTLWIISCAFLCITNSIVVALFCFQSHYGSSCFQLILFVLVTLFSCSSAMFHFPLMGLIRGEILPQSVKMLGAGLSTFLISLVSFFYIRSFLPIAEAFGTEINFTIYACCALVLLLYVYFDVPETRGKTLVEIQNELKGVKEDKQEFSHL